jgi:hypothetical protein
MEFGCPLLKQVAVVSLIQPRRASAFLCISVSEIAAGTEQHSRTRLRPRCCIRDFRFLLNKLAQAAAAPCTALACSCGRMHAPEAKRDNAERIDARDADAADGRRGWRRRTTASRSASLCRGCL